MITPQQQKAIEYLSAGWSQTAVANNLGVSKVTITRWKADDDFMEALLTATDDKIGALRFELKRAGAKAVETLLVVMETSEQDGARVRAAEVILRYQAELTPNDVPQLGVLVPELMEKLGCAPQ